MKLVGIKQNLCELCIRELKSTAFFNPCCSRLGRCDVDFVVAGSSNLVAELTHNILAIKYLNQAAVVLFRNKITAIGIDTFLKYIGHLTEIGTKCS